MQWSGVLITCQDLHICIYGRRCTSALHFMDQVPYYLCFTYVPRLPKIQKISVYYLRKNFLLINMFLDERKKCLHLLLLLLLFFYFVFEIVLSQIRINRTQFKNLQITKTFVWRAWSRNFYQKFWDLYLSKLLILSKIVHQQTVL